MSSTSFLGSNNLNILHMHYETGFIGIGCYDTTSKMEVAGDVVARSNLKALGMVSMCNNLEVASQVLATQIGSSNLPAFTFAPNSNTGMYLPAINELAFTTGGKEHLRITTTGDITTSAALQVGGDMTVTSNVTIMGRLSVSNVTYITSNVFIYSSETINSNLTVSGSAVFNSNAYTGGPATFSNLVTLASHGGSVVFSTSNNMLGLNLAGSAPRADLDISNGNILAKNFQKLSKNAQTSNPLSITINWDSAYDANNLYYIVADVYQSIANGDNAGFRTQRIGVGVSNSTLAWAQAQQVFGSSNAYTTLNLQVAASTSNSITLESSTSWTAAGEYAHGVNVDVVSFPYTSNIGNIYLS
jgi:hypothetical protein